MKDLWIEASAGSGKTSVIVNLALEELVQGARVLCISYTTAAKDEMEKRISLAMGKKISTIPKGRLYCHTMHSLALHLISRVEIANVVPIEVSPAVQLLLSTTSQWPIKKNVVTHGFSGNIAPYTSNLEVLQQLREGVTEECRFTFTYQMENCYPHPTPQYAALYLHEDGMPRKIFKWLKNKELLPLVDAEQRRLLQYYDEVNQWEITHYEREIITKVNRILQEPIISFSNMIHKAMDLLRLGSPHPFLTSIDSIMVDEAQDLSPVQWDFFHLVLKHATTSKVVIVGDPKQSIFSFQGADYNTFQRQKLILDARRPITTKLLRTNYRSGKVINTFINRVFSGVFGDNVHQQHHVFDGTITIHPLVPEVGNAGIALVTNMVINKLLGIHNVYLESKKRYATYEDVMILYQRKGKIVPSIIEGIAANNIPYHHRQSSLVTTKLYQFFLNISKLAFPIYKTEGLWQLFFHLKVSHQSIFPQDLLDKLAYVPAPTAIALLLDTDVVYRWIRDHHAFTDLRDIYTSALEFGTNANLMAFLMMDHLKSVPRGEGGVNITSCHGAKGLQAPIVMMVDANQPLGLRVTTVMVNGINVHYKASYKRHKKMKEAYDATKIQQYCEAQRLLYVAVSRVEEHLMVYGWGQRRSSSWYTSLVSQFPKGATRFTSP